MMAFFIKIAIFLKNIEFECKKIWVVVALKILTFFFFTTKIFKMKSIFLLGLVCVAIIAVFAQEEGPAGKKILVVLDDLKTKSSHSQYFRSLEERGYDLTYFGADDRNLQLKKYGDFLYDHLVFFAPTASEIAGASSQTILEFIDAGHNVIFAGDSDLGDIIREVASECNVEFDDSGSSVIDHSNFDSSDFGGAHTLIAADNFANVPVIFKDISAPVLFRGIGQDIEEDSALLFPLLSGAATSYSASSDPVRDLFVAGKKTVLVSGLQARNNARVIFSGSLELFSDKFFNSQAQKSADGKKQPSGNQEFAKQITQWALQEKGVLRSKNAIHHRIGEKDAPFAYTIKEDVEFSIELEEWNGRRWVPFVANDVQLEYRMIDPYVRTSLKSDGKGKFSTTFKLPDIYGVFTFKVEYIRQGYSFVNSISRIPVRPFRHNEYERFIDSAYPYYFSSLSMLAGLFVFSWVFLYNRDK